jgi:ADP-heptose:LPS heptosyltransferase
MTLQSNPRRVLLVTTGHVGSNIFFTPAIRLLKRRLPAVRFDVVAASRRGTSAFEGNPDVDAVMHRRSAGGVRRLAARYDLVLGLHHDHARRTLGGDLGNAVLIDAENGDHRAEQALQFVRGLLRCEVTEHDRRYVICPQPRNHARAERLLRARADDDILVGFHLGTGRTAVHGWKFWFAGREADTRLWPGAAYVAVAQELRATGGRIRPVLVGLRNERFLARRFRRQVPDTIDLTGRTSLLDLTAVLARLDVVICGDSGVLHVACAAGVPLVALFGPSSPPVRTGPYPQDPRRIVLRAEPIEEIRVEQVVAALSELLATRTALAARSAERRA